MSYLSALSYIEPDASLLDSTLNNGVEIEVECKKEKPIQHDVTIDIRFMRIGEIDGMNEKYQAEIFIEACWEEKSYINKYDPAIHWNPMLYIENLLTEIKTTVDYSVDYDEYGNCIITESRNIKGILKRVFFY